MLVGGLPVNAPLRDVHVQHAGKVSDKWSAYFETYEEVFEPYQDQPLALLEIGVQNGGSLEVWSRYFPRATHLVGCDIDPLCGKLSFSDPRIGVVVGDAGRSETEEAIAAISPDYTIVIDDGSHRSGDIVRAFALYFPRVRMGGVYAAEDLHCSYWQQFEGGLFDPHSAIAFFKRLADLINHEHWGVPGTRAEVLRPFFERYGCTIAEEVLASIHSVAFYNSVCVVRREPPERNLLGRRILAGSDAAVSGEVPALVSEISVAPRQEENRWSLLDALPEDRVYAVEAELALIREQLATQEGELAFIREQLATQEGELAFIREQLATQEGELAFAREALVRREAELAGFPARVAQAVADAVAPLEARLQEATDRYRQMQASRSWRLTAPLRAFARWARSERTEQNN